MTTQTQTQSAISQDWHGIDGYKTYVGSVTIQKLNKSKVFTAIDESGSTQGYRFAVERSVLSRFMSSSTSAPKCAGWTDRFCGMYTSIPDTPHGGGTNPSCLFSSVECCEALSSCDTFVMATDGKIDSGSVKDFSHIITQFQNIKMFIGILVDERTISSASDCNISVFAGLMSQPCMIFYAHKRDGMVQLVYSNGVTHDMPELHYVSIDQIMNIPITSVPNVPEGYVPMGNNEYVNLDLLFSRNDLNTGSLLNMNYENIMMLCKTLNRLQDFRSWVSQYRKFADVPQVTSPSEPLLVQTINRFIHASDEERVELRQQISQLRAQVNCEIILAKQSSKSQSRPFRAFFEGILKRLSEITSATYTLGSLRSNRAGRAQAVEATVTEDNISYDGCFLGTCSVTYEENVPMALILRKPHDTTLNTSDFALNFPFAVQNIEMASPDVVSVQMAKYLVQTGRDLTRSPILNYIPLINLSSSINRQYIKRLVCEAFVCGQDLSHAWRLFFSFLHVIQTKEWCSSTPDMANGVRYMMEQILDHHITTADFGDSGEKVTLGNAITSFLSNSNIQRHPLSSVLLMLNVAKEFKLPLPLDNGLNIVRQKFMRHMVEVLLPQAKENFPKLRESILRLMYEWRYGVPLRSSIHTVGYSDWVSTVTSLSSTNIITKSLQRYASNINMGLEEIITPSIITGVYGRFLHKHAYQQYRPEGLFDYFLQTSWFASLTAGDDMTTEQLLNEIDLYKYYHHIESSVPEFATACGPSVIVGLNHEMMIPTGTYNLDQLEQACQYYRPIYMANTYQSNSVSPCYGSSSYNLHVSIRKVLDNQPRPVNRQTCVDVLRRVIRSAGNVHEPYLMKEIAMGIHSYNQVLESGSHNVQRTTLRARLEEELCRRGITGNTVTITPTFDTDHPLPRQTPLTLTDTEWDDICAPLQE